jgi:phenylalanyl-tRNA synthetase alpha chain
MTTQTTLEELSEAAHRELAAASTEEALEAWRIAYLGRKGRLTQILRSLGTLPLEERKRAGAAANRLKAELESAYEARRGQVERERLERALGASRIDVTLPPRPLPRGRLHPITQTTRAILDAFASMGFSVAEGPEVETDYYNFEALRIPADHPARELMDTFYVERRDPAGPKLLLRTHTSPNQVRIMERHRPPIRIVVPGRCYRHEATDPTHEWMMVQVEVLAVDQGITMAHLKGTLFEFAKRLFGQERRVRFRCDYFPFVEPGVDLAIDCFLCGGEGCRTCNGEGWIEIMGAGMVHPEILANMGYDPERYTGFAAGMGVERIAMLRHGIDDIRNFYANDLRFLRQF